MKATGLKLICERADGEITTWHDVFETTVEDVINNYSLDAFGVPVCPSFGLFTLSMRETNIN